MLAVAISDHELARVLSRLDALGAESTATVEPAPNRVVVLATLADEAACESVAARLRDEGWMAVSRPSGGAALEAWRRRTRPAVVADRVSVAPAWSEHDRAGMPGLIEIGPGGFGNGHHPTTRLLIELLVERLDVGAHVLDVGCGSGVLALVALELGASSALAVDRKPEAVDATRRNAELNGVGSRLRATCGPVPEGGGRFDVVVANIAREGVVSLAPILVGAVAPTGWLAVSGITPAQSELVAGHLAPLVETDRRVDGEWAAVVFSRRGSAAPR